MPHHHRPACRRGQDGGGGASPQAIPAVGSVRQPRSQHGARRLNPLLWSGEILMKNLSMEFMHNSPKCFIIYSNKPMTFNVN